MGLGFGGVLLCSGGGENEPLEQKKLRTSDLQLSHVVL